MIFFKSCPKCGGDMHINSDIYGHYKQCLNCGMMKDIASPRTRDARLVEAEKNRRAN